MPAHTTYLEARKVVDDAALNDRIFRSFANRIAEQQAAVDRPLRVLEIGSGIGTMVVRLIERGVLNGAITYRLVEQDPMCSSFAEQWLTDWLTKEAYEISTSSTGVTVASGAHNPRELSLQFDTADAFSLTPSRTYDVIIGSAFFDIVSLNQALPWMESVIHPAGVIYAPLTYNAQTAFEPVDSLDRTIISEYHRHMDTVRSTPGGSDAGEKLANRFEESETFKLVDSGASNWSVNAAKSHDHALVVEAVIEMIASAIAEIQSPDVTQEETNRWVARRRGEVADSALQLTVHHIDTIAECTNATS